MYLRLRFKLTMTMLFLFAATLAWSADPFVGTWKVDVEKSLYRTGTAPKSMTITIAESGGDQDTTVATTTADGTEISWRFTVPTKGGTGKVVQGVGFDSVSAKRIDDRTRETRYSQGAKEVRTVRMAIAKDGKTMNTTVTGLDGQGKPLTANLISGRQ